MLGCAIVYQQRRLQVRWQLKPKSLLELFDLFELSRTAQQFQIPWRFGRQFGFKLTPGVFNATATCIQLVRGVVLVQFDRQLREVLLAIGRSNEQILEFVFKLGFELSLNYMSSLFDHHFPLITKARV